METQKKVIEIPEVVPVLPVRNTVLFPNAAIPLIVGRSRSIEAIHRAKKTSDVILIVAQRDATKEDPRPDDLFRVGVVCLISKITEMKGGGYQLIANGLLRFEIRDFIDRETFLEA